MSYIGSKNYALEVSRGNVSGVASVLKFGRSIDVDASTDTDIWDGADGSTSTDIWVPPTTARTHDIASTSTNDTNSSGTGMRSVLIEGLDASWAPQSETVNLNGTSNAPTANTYTRIFRMTGQSWGTGTVNAGVITATAQTDGTVTAAILAGNNQTLMAIYTVPASKTLYIDKYYAQIDAKSASGAELDVELLIKESVDVANQGYLIKHIQGINENFHLNHFFEPYLKVEAKSDVVMRAVDCSSADTAIDAGFQGYLVDD